MSKIRRFGFLAIIFGAALALPGLSAAQTSWYLGAGFGHASVDEGTIDDQDTSWKILGGYNFNPNFAVEGLWADFGEFTSAFVGGSRTIAEADGFGIGVRGEIPLGERFGLYGRVGALFWDAESRVQGTGASPIFPAGSDDGTDVYFGIGGRVKFNQAVSLFLDYDLFSLDPADVDMWTLGLQFDFGQR